MLEIGLKNKRSYVVREADTAQAHGSGTLPVFATPAMVALMERMAMESLEYYFNDLCAVICLTWDQIESSGVAGAELEDLTSLPRSIEGVEVGLTYRQQRDGSFRISVRTSGSIDACNIARRLGGGGHTRAAGCEISGNLDNAKHAVLEEVRKELQRCGLLDQDAG